jgi:transcriptional regulator, PadR family
LYPNLDELVSEGLVEKSELDKRTNLYELTTEGQQTVSSRVEWILSKYATSDSRASDVSDLINV